MLYFRDLSDNILTGEVPDFLKNLTSLKVLNLTGNNFTGSIPSSLLKRSEEGSLILRFTNHTIPGNTESKKKMNTVIIVVSCCAVLGLLLILMLAGWFFWLRKGGKVLVASNVTRHIEATIAQKTEYGPHLQIDGGKFTFNHLQVITNNFAQVIRKGAFASFYLGHLDGLKLQSKCIHDLLHSRPENLNLREKDKVIKSDENLPTEDHAEQEYAPLTEESKDTEGTTNETEEKEKDKEMTLEEYEKIKEEKRKRLLALKAEERSGRLKSTRMYRQCSCWQQKKKWTLCFLLSWVLTRI
ncbi:probable LRR receptor-like serine/threonine-protein kinase At1g05700 isoform X1 [Zingiber officinale]|nr:probable LRR receptor-like serine/threonine-protein kinase At1g05700 isoform X1 [Zingiber officinale]